MTVSRPAAGDAPIRAGERVVVTRAFDLTGRFHLLDIKGMTGRVVEVRGGRALVQMTAWPVRAWLPLWAVERVEGEA